MTQQISSRLPAQNGERGFTLVELAIVLIIIGLLIGGILKGQELIANAQVKSTVSQIKSFDAAVTTFRDSYGSLPGDILAPDTRLPGCTAAPCSQPGNGNGRIDTPATLGNLPVDTDEGFTMWSHMDAADIITGINGDTVAFGTGLPSASIGGGFWAGYSADGTATSLSDTNPMRVGHYLVLTGDAAGNVSQTSGPLTPSQAERIDRVLDDGNPSTGTVRSGGDDACDDGNATVSNAIYQSNQDNVLCGLYIRFQG